LGEDIENQTCPVNHPALKSTFKISLLGRRKLVIEDDKICSVSRNIASHLLNLAFAGVGRRIGTLSPPMNNRTDGCPRRLGKQLYLFDLFRDVICAEIKLNDNRALTRRGTLNHENAFRESQTTRLSAPAHRNGRLGHNREGQDSFERSSDQASSTPSC
jgi:hypothetical protein